MLEKYAADAQEGFNAVASQIRELAESKPELAESNTELLAANAVYLATGTATFAAAVIWGNLTMQLTYNSGEKVQFYGEHWGVGVGAGVCAGAALLAVPAKELIGHGTYQVISLGYAVGETTIHLWRGSQYLGLFKGAALAVDAMAMSGSGHWRAI